MNHIYWLTDNPGIAKNRFFEDVEEMGRQFGRYNLKVSIPLMQIQVGDITRRYVAIGDRRDFDRKLCYIPRTAQIRLDEKALFSGETILRLIKRFKEIL